MKLVIYAWAALLIAGCTASTSNQTKLVFSGAFQLPLSADLLAGTSIFSIDGIAIKTSKGTTLSGSIITHESESLPASFPLQDYPDFILQGRNTTLFDPAIQELLAGIQSEIDYSYGLDNLVAYQAGESMIHRLCKQGKCLGYVTKASVTDHLLMIHSDGFTKDEFDRFVKEL